MSVSRSSTLLNMNRVSAALSAVASHAVAVNQRRNKGFGSRTWARGAKSWGRDGGPLSGVERGRNPRLVLVVKGLSPTSGTGSVMFIVHSVVREGKSRARTAAAPRRPASLGRTLTGFGPEAIEEHGHPEPKAAGGDLALHLRAPGVERAGQRVAQLALDRVLLHVAVSPVDLERVARRLHVRLAHEQLGHRRLEHRALAPVLHRADAVEQEAPGLDRHLHVGDAVTPRLELGD